LLQDLQFRSDHRFRPIIDALALIQCSVGSHRKHVPEAVSIPIDGVVAPQWQEKVFAEIKGERRVHRHY